MKLQGAADTAVGAGALQQRADLLDGGLTAILAELERALHFRRQLGVFEQRRHGFLLQVFDGTAVLLQPRLQFGDLIDGGNSAAGDFGELAIDLRRQQRLGDLACGFRQAAIDAETALINCRVKDPERLFRRRQRRQSREQFTLGFDVLLDSTRTGARDDPDPRTNRCRSDPHPCAACAASPSSASAGGRRHPSGAAARAHVRRSSSLAGSDSASAIAIVQRCRSIGISGQPKRGPRMCCSIAISKCRVMRDHDPVRIVGGFV